MNSVNSVNLAYGYQITIDVSEYMNMIEKIERLEKENFSLKKEVAVLTHKSGCMLEQHVGTLLEKNVLNKKLEEEMAKYDELKVENENIKKELENARRRFGEYQQKTNDQLKNAQAEIEEKENALKIKEKDIIVLREEASMALKKSEERESLLQIKERNIKLLKEEANMSLKQLEEKENILKDKERDLNILKEKDSMFLEELGRKKPLLKANGEDKMNMLKAILKDNSQLSTKLCKTESINKDLFEENISFGYELKRIRQAGCWKRLLKKW